MVNRNGMGKTNDGGGSGRRYGDYFNEREKRITAKNRQEKTCRIVIILVILGAVILTLTWWYTLYTCIRLLTPIAK